RSRALAILCVPAVFASCQKAATPLNVDTVLRLESELDVPCGENSLWHTITVGATNDGDRVRGPAKIDVRWDYDTQALTYSFESANLPATVPVTSMMQIIDGEPTELKLTVHATVGSGASKQEYEGYNFFELTRDSTPSRRDRATLGADHWQIARKGAHGDRSNYDGAEGVGSFVSVRQPNFGGTI